ncbi:PAS domain S-box protein [Mariprofundus erugo]|uniref:sensor histidine kinase n=1 Tax=Mariprofundus erugo TaxID=2528639 RepID=UPI0010FF458A|nr:PAS domain-containing sensor histidine kinase [Mariprofundus erugo]TLS74038.1 PAS domain S-box protein [Mariprofundus erugo]
MAKDGCSSAETPALDVLLHKQLSSWNIAVTAFVMMLLASAVIALMAFTLYKKESSTLLGQMRSEAALEVQGQKQTIEHELRQVIHALLFFNRQADLHDVFSSAAGKEQITEDLRSFMLSSTVYDQARILDRQGRELIRINYHGGAPVVVSGSQLQDKSDRYYFKAMQRLSRHDIYISALDLNVEHGAVEQPFKPTLRVGMAVYQGDENRPAGYIIMNYLAVGMLDRFRDSGLLVQGDLLLVNRDGYPLSAPTHEQEWGFMFPSSSSLSMASRDPALWQQIMRLDSGTLRHKDDDYILQTISPYQVAAEIPALHGTPVSSGQSDALTWKVLIHLTPAHLQAAMVGYRGALFSWLAASMLLVIVLAIPVAWLIERRRVCRGYIALLSQAVEHAGESMMVTDLRGRIEYVNPAFTSLTGYTFDESIGRNPSELLKSTAQDKAFYRQLWETISAGKQWRGKIVDRRKDGSLFPAQMTITPIRDTEGSIRHFMAVQQDYTEHELLQERISNENKMKVMGIAVGGIAHEFNNILAALTANVYLLKRIEKDNPAALAKLNAMDRLDEQAAGMVRQMLAYVGRAEVHLTRRNVTPFFRMAMQACRRSVPEHIVLNSHVADVEMMVDADELQLQKVMDHLISNAVDAVEGIRGAEISQRLERLEEAFGDTGDMQQWLVFRVQDNGMGIAAEHQQLLFEPFFTTKEVGRGTGLGLSTVHGIIEKHHGFVRVDSEPGKGSCFSVYLPIAL